uniref:Uncharacterized protein n=1 Tax=Arundo donax TaxID=35708 RepID=A0A0A9N912_ARUDO
MFVLIFLVAKQSKSKTDYSHLFAKMLSAAGFGVSYDDNIISWKV